MFLTWRTQDITYWAPLPGDDGFGKRNLASPIQFMGRWTDKQEQTVDARGNEIISKSEIYTDDDTALAIDGYLFQGTTDVVDPRPLKGAFKILNIGRVPNLRNLEALRTAIL
jgi:hypothetical protein